MTPGRCGEGKEERGPGGQDIKFTLIIRVCKNSLITQGLSSCHSSTPLHYSHPALLAGTQINSAFSCLRAFPKTVNFAEDALCLKALGFPLLPAACPEGSFTHPPWPGSSPSSPVICSLHTCCSLLSKPSVCSVGLACLPGRLLRDREFPGQKNCFVYHFIPPGTRLDT